MQADSRLVIVVAAAVVRADSSRPGPCTAPAGLVGAGASACSTERVGLGSNIVAGWLKHSSSSAFVEGEPAFAVVEHSGFVSFEAAGAAVWAVVGRRQVALGRWG